MDDRDSIPDVSDAPRPTPSRGGDPGDAAQVADDEATTPRPHGTESSYSAAARPKARPVNTRRSDDAPFEVRIEFVQLDGPAGRALRRRQALIMRKVLRWIAEHPDRGNR